MSEKLISLSLTHFFTKKLPLNSKIMSVLFSTFSSTEDQGTYLCVPFVHTRAQSHLYKPLLEKFALKVVSWKKTYLSKVGMPVMIKSILQSVPTQMSCLKLPQTICNVIEKSIRRFYWRGNQAKNKIHWIGLDTL